jgi:hypothetical protein
MVQVQSTWFPVIDRNPQKFVPSIYQAGHRLRSGNPTHLLHSRDALPPGAAGHSCRSTARKCFLEWDAGPALRHRDGNIMTLLWLLRPNRRWAFSRCTIHGGSPVTQSYEATDAESCFNPGRNHQPHRGGRQACRHPHERGRPDRHPVQDRCLLRLSAGAGSIEPGVGRDPRPSPAMHWHPAHAAQRGPHRPGRGTGNAGRRGGRQQSPPL